MLEDLASPSEQETGKILLLIMAGNSQQRCVTEGRKGEQISMMRTFQRSSFTGLEDKSAIVKRSEPGAFGQSNRNKLKMEVGLLSCRTLK